MLIVALKNQYKAPEPMARLGLPRSSYFYHSPRITLKNKYLPMCYIMADIFERNHRCYGYRRFRASLQPHSITISEKVVRRLMKQEALSVPKPKRRRYNSYLGEISPAPENIVNRAFHAAAPNEKWLTGITECHIRAGKVYLSPIIDCFDGLVTSWAISTRPDADLANTMLDAALATIVDRNARPIIHSDRGGHYRWPGWLERVTAVGLVRSMSRKASLQTMLRVRASSGASKTSSSIRVIGGDSP